MCEFSLSNCDGGKDLSKCMKTELLVTEFHFPVVVVYVRTLSVALQWEE